MGLINKQSLPYCSDTSVVSKDEAVSMSNAVLLSLPETWTVSESIKKLPRLIGKLDLSVDLFSTQIPDLNLCTDVCHRTPKGYSHFGPIVNVTTKWCHLFTILVAVNVT